MDSTGASTFAFMAWSIWTHRNLTQLYKPSCNLRELAHVSKGHLDEFLAINPLPQLRSLHYLEFIGSLHLQI